VDGTDEGLLVDEAPHTELQFQLVDLGQLLIWRFRVGKPGIGGHDPTKEVKAYRGELGSIARSVQLIQEHLLEKFWETIEVQVAKR
jgi:hypothetical protein